LYIHKSQINQNEKKILIIAISQLLLVKPAEVKEVKNLCRYFSVDERIY
jgi:hypothetical protein